MKVSQFMVHNCNWYFAGSGDAWTISIQDQCEFGLNKNFVNGKWKNIILGKHEINSSIITGCNQWCCETARTIYS